MSTLTQAVEERLSALANLAGREEEHSTFVAQYDETLHLLMATLAAMRQLATAQAQWAKGREQNGSGKWN